MNKTFIALVALLLSTTASAQIISGGGGGGGGGGAPTGAAGGDLSGTYPNPAVAQVNGVSPGPFYSDTDAANLTGTVPANTLLVTDTTKTTDYPVAAADMGQVLNLSSATARTLTLPAKAADLWQPGQTLSLANTSTAAWTLTNSTTLTGLGLTTTLQPGQSVTLIANANGTGLDCFGCQQIATISHSVGWIAGTNPDDAPIFVADQPMVVTSLVARIGALTGAAATLSVYKAASGTACASGTIQHSGSVNANSGANTNQTLTLAGGTDNNLSAGDSLCLDTTGTWTSGTGVITASVRPR